MDLDVGSYASATKLPYTWKIIINNKETLKYGGATDKLQDKK